MPPHLVLIHDLVDRAKAALPEKLLHSVLPDRGGFVLQADDVDVLHRLLELLKDGDVRGLAKPEVHVAQRKVTVQGAVVVTDVDERAVELRRQQPPEIVGGGAVPFATEFVRVTSEEE